MRTGPDHELDALAGFARTHSHAPE
jgi:hypothetical protein